MRIKYFTALVFFIIYIVFSVKSGYAQVVYQSYYHEDLYDFLDELAGAKIISLNSAIKPYSRNVIFEKLTEAKHAEAKLNKRQLADLNFYLKDYKLEDPAVSAPNAKFEWASPFLYYKDTLFSVAVNPILGLSSFSNDSGHFYHRWNGAEVYGYIGKNFGFYANLRDNHESVLLSNPGYLNQNPGADYKLDNKGGGDYDEMRGGITYSWKWGTAGIIKEQFAWGDNYHGANIFSGKSPSFIQIYLHAHPVRWLDFNYVHGWLISNVIDSSKTFYSGGFPNRYVFRPKYLAANMATVSLLHGLDVSIGNSIIYSDQNVNPAFLVPIFFYKSVDHELNSANSNLLGQNSQMFFNISSRNIKNVHLYTSWFIDEINFHNLRDPKSQSNFISAKFGLRLSNFIVPNLFATFEYTRTNPITYRHYVLTSTFVNDDYNLGHYLGDNAQELFGSIGFKPVSKLSIEISFSKAEKGFEYPYDGMAASGKGNPFLDSVYWHSEVITFKARYQLVNDCYLFASIANSNTEGVMTKFYTQPYYVGKLTTINVGANIGF